MDNIGSLSWTGVYYETDSLSTGWIVGISLIAIFGLTIFISGIVSAARTTDTEMSIGRLLLHIFIWGGFIAAIVYAVKTSNNRNSMTHMPQQAPQSTQSREEELLKRIEELEKNSKKK